MLYFPTDKTKLKQPMYLTDCFKEGILSKYESLRHCLHDKTLPP